MSLFQEGEVNKSLTPQCAAHPPTHLHTHTHTHTLPLALSVVSRTFIKLCIKLYSVHIIYKLLNGVHMHANMNN